MQELSSLQQKISRLVKNYEALKAAHEKLAKTLSEKERIVLQQEQHIAGLEDRLRKAAIAGQLSEEDPAGKAALKQFLDELIGKIDQHIILLNH